MFSSLKIISPDVGSLNPIIHLPIVVFPEPLSPISPSVFPLSISKETLLTAFKVSLDLTRKFLCRFLTFIKAVIKLFFTNFFGKVTR